VALVLSFFFSWCFGSLALFVQPPTCSESLQRIGEKKEHKIRTLLEELAINFFLTNTPPETGMMLDRAPAFGRSPDSNTMASLGGTGFGFTVLAHAAQKGKITPELAQNLIEKGMQFALGLENHKGWLPHFVHGKTGTPFVRGVWPLRWFMKKIGYFLCPRLYEFS